MISFRKWTRLLLLPNINIRSRTIHSTIESWSCIKCTLVHIAKSNRKQQQQQSEETNPSLVELRTVSRPSISCRRFVMATTGNSSAGPNCGFICLFSRYAHISKEFNYTRRGREFKHMHVSCGGNCSSLKIKSRATKCTMSRVCVCW